jgi:hypothetical protein
MCFYDSVLGSGPVLVLQMLTVGAIIATAFAWVWAYLRSGVDIRRYALPIGLWFVFGTLDIVITAKGVLAGSHTEANTLAAFVFSVFGAYGPVMASMLWISLWAGAVLVINRLKVARAEFITLAVFYSLAVGHFIGFSSWFQPFCIFSQTADVLVSGMLQPFVIILAGCALAVVHLNASRFS